MRFLSIRLATLLPLLLLGCQSTDDEVKPAAKEPAAQKTSVPDGLRGKDRADAILARWRAQNPDRDWIETEVEQHEITAHADNSALLGGAQEGGQTYGRFTRADLVLWERETTKLVVAGSKIFHSADELGSTVAVSCDMCHPHAANTHPETYPKFQVQMGRVILLRDMINWCLQQPVRAKPLATDGFKLRALEAYLYAQRKGTPLDWGKH